MRTAIIISILASLILIACDKENGPVNSEGSALGLWDMRVGNAWTYEIITYRGAQMSDVLVRDTTTLKIIGKRIINGETWYQFTNSNNDTFYYYNRGQSLWQYFPERGKSTMILKYPTYVGEINKQINEKYITTGVDKSVQTPCGAFKCVQYTKWSGDKKPLDGRSDVYCYCPGQGLVSYKLIQRVDIANGVADTLWYEGRLIRYNQN